MAAYISTLPNTIHGVIEKSAAQGMVSLRADLLQKIGSEDPARRTALEEKLQGLEDAYQSMQQARQDMSVARKETARRKIAQIKAQIQALQLAGGDADSRARKIARLARELAGAVKDYKAAGGQGGTAMATSTAGASAQPETNLDVTGEAAAVQASAVVVVSFADITTGQTFGAGETAKASREADRTFAEEARRLARQLKNMLRDGEDDRGANRYLGQALRSLVGFGLSAPVPSAAYALDVTV